LASRRTPIKDFLAKGHFFPSSAAGTLFPLGNTACQAPVKKPFLPVDENNAGDDEKNADKLPGSDRLF